MTPAVRGLAQVTNWVKLKFAAMNLKKLAKRKWKERYPSYMICFELLISNYLRKNPSFAQAKLGFLDSLRRTPRKRCAPLIRGTKASP